MTAKLFRGPWTYTPCIELPDLPALPTEARDWKVVVSEFTYGCIPQPNPDQEKPKR